MLFQKWVEPIVDKIDNNISYLMPSAFGVMRQFSAHTPPFKLTCKCISQIHTCYIYVHIFGPTYESGYQPFFSQIALSWVGISFGVVLPLSLFFFLVSYIIQILEDMYLKFSNFALLIVTIEHIIKITSMHRIPYHFENIIKSSL